MPDDGYVVVSATFLSFTEKAVFIQAEDAPAPVWVPRSCLHGADDRAVETLSSGYEVEFRVRKWLADQEGLI